MKIILIEDEKPAARLLKRRVEKLGYEITEMLHSVEESVAWLKTNSQPDLIFLDIQLSDGLSFEIFNQVDVSSAIIFTTAYPEYAADAFDLNVVDYVRKPLKKERLQQAFEKAKTHLTSPKKRFFEWNTGLGKTKIASDTLLYVRTSEIDSRDKIALLKDQSEITLKNINFKTLLTLLKDKNFVQINKKEAISVSIVNAFSDSEIVTKLSNNEDSVIKLSLSDAYRGAFEEAFK